MNRLHLQPAHQPSRIFTRGFSGLSGSHQLNIEVVERVIQVMKDLGSAGVYGLLIGRTESPRNIEITDVKPMDGRYASEEDWAGIDGLKRQSGWTAAIVRL